MKVQALVLAIAAVGFVGCSHSEKRAEKPAPTAQEQAVSQLGADRDAYVTATQARITTMEKLANDLRSRAAQTQKPASKKLENAADDMDSYTKDIQRQLTDVKNSAPENWVDEKRDVEKVLSRAESHYSNAVTLLQ